MKTTVIVEDKEGNFWLPAYTGFNKVMGKNSLVIPFRTVLIDSQWYEIGEVDVAREAYPVKPISIEDWVSDPPKLDDDTPE